MDEADGILEPLLADRPEEVVETLLATCAAVRKAAPDACELIFSTYVVGSVFTLTGKMGGAFCHPVAYANHVNLGFNRGAELSDPEGLLAGTGKLIRHVRIESPAMLRRRAVQKLIAEAAIQGELLAQAKGGAVPKRVVEPKAGKSGEKRADKRSVKRGRKSTSKTDSAPAKRDGVKKGVPRSPRRKTP